jgi:cell filamentation protein, protein adenylyltransferase
MAGRIEWLNIIVINAIFLQSIVDLMHFIVIFYTIAKKSAFMDVTKFTEKKTGQLIPISLPEKDTAFIPDPLPPNWAFDNELWPLLIEAQKNLGLLDGMARTLPNPNLLLTPLRTNEALTSSRLEGTYATAQELILFEMDPKPPTSVTDQKNAWLEVANYNLALNHGFTELDKLPLCLRVVKELHRTLLTGVRGAQAVPGEFRTHQVHIGSTRRYVPPPPDEMLKCLFDLEKYLNLEDGVDKLVKCFIAHYQLEAIHPFGDGNGRVGRVLLSLMIHRLGDLQQPWLYLSPYFEKYKDEYIDNMFAVSAEGAWSKWISFCLRGVVEQAKEAVRVCDELRALRQAMHAKEACGSGRIHTIIDGLFDRPFVRIADLARKNEVTYHTAKSDVEFLVKNNILKPLPDVRTKTYFAHDIFRIAYK